MMKRNREQRINSGILELIRNAHHVIESNNAIQLYDSQDEIICAFQVGSYWGNFAKHYKPELGKSRAKWIKSDCPECETINDA